MNTSAAPSMITCFGGLQDVQQRGISARGGAHPTFDSRPGKPAGRTCRRSGCKEWHHRCCIPVAIRGQHRFRQTPDNPLAWRDGGFHPAAAAAGAGALPVPHPFCAGADTTAGSGVRGTECTGAARHRLLRIYAAEVTVEGAHECVGEHDGYCTQCRHNREGSSS